MGRKLHPAALLFAGLAFAAGASSASATSWQVPGDMSNTCTIAVPSCDTIAQAVAASAPGDDIQIGAGSFPVTATQNLVHALTITGAGIANTTVATSSGVIAFDVRASGIVIQDLTISGGATGIRFPVTSDDTEITRVGFSANTSRGVDISTGAGVPVTNVSITDSAFATANIGLRMSSNSTVNGLSITGTSFTGNTYGIYQANDGATSTLTNLAVDDCTFTSNVNYGIYAEEMRDSTIENSSFSGGANGLIIIKFYSSNGQPISNVTIRGNDFSNFTGNALDIEMRGMGLDQPITIENNTIVKNVGTQTVAAAVFVRLHPTLANGAVNFVDNEISLTGTFGAGTAAHAVQLRGNGPVTFTGNVLDGGNVGGSGTTPASSGIFIESRSGSVIMPATTVISGSCNRIQGFHNGISVFDSFALAYGGLTAGATVSFEDNVIAGNDQAGVINGASTTLDFDDNYWGCAAGPGNPGCDSVSGDVNFTPFATTPPACVDCIADAECADGLACNGAETCNLGTGMCEAGTPVVCDDGLQCTADACSEPTGTCVAPPEPDGTSCSDGITCSIPDSCQAGVCDGGGTDGNANNICDEDEVGPLTLSRMIVKAQRGPGNNGKVIAKGTLVTAPPTDVLDASGPITLRATAGGLDVSRTFAIGECVMRGPPTKQKVLCKSADRKSKATFKPNKNVANGFKFTAKLGALAIDPPFMQPGTLTLTYGPGTVRSGSIAVCQTKPTGLLCKAP